MAIASTEEALRQAMDALDASGLMFLHDARKPSLTALVAGAPIKGSWWGHPAGKRIFQVASALEDGAKVLFVPLLSAKVTLVHRRLWPALVSVGEARAAWQMDPLAPRARELLANVHKAGRVRATGPSSKALARALLVHAEQVHTAGGSHATELVSWSTVREAREIAERLGEDTARRELEDAAATMDSALALPWARRR
ncbi:MAG TPA: hypothetical protein VFF12_12115 [Myxococcaceae bacterium]|nr:hypothetical protein [Myxococcaceae bacterium]